MRYKAYGVVFDSELNFTELSRSVERGCEVWLKLQKLPENLDLRSADKWFCGDSTRFWFRVSGVGEFLVQNGNEIIVQAATGADMALVRLFTIGSAFAALMHQRGALVLHGAVLAKDGKTVLFTGESGAGKSTLAAMLWKRGYTVVAEDVAVLHKQDSTWSVHPGYPFMRICPDMYAALQLEINPAELTRIFTHTEKYLLQLQDRFAQAPAVLNEIVILAKTAQPEYRQQTCSSNMDKFAVVASNTYRPYFLQTQGLVEQHFRQCASLLGQLTVRKIARPELETDIYRTCDFVEQVVWEQK